MNLSVFSPVFTGMTLEEALKYLNQKGINRLELGVGCFAGTVHADAKELIKSKQKSEALKSLLDKYGIKISALSVHGNGVHPVAQVAKEVTEYFAAACRLAELLNVDRVVTFSGCPGDGKGDFPNWVTCPWPPEYGDLLKYQWNDVLIPYWEKQVKVAEDHNVKICFEMHPGFCVYNPHTLLKLREAVGKTIGANLDPSHLFWQGIDLFAAIKHLGEAIYFVHAKDTYIDKTNVSVNGVIDAKSYADEFNRSWIFRTVGYGHGGETWKEIVSALRLAGYDYVLSIEHEDSLMTPLEGLGKAIEFLKKVIITEETSNSGKWWI